MLRIEDLETSRTEIADWFVERYRSMLADNLDEHLLMKALAPQAVD